MLIDRYILLVGGQYGSMESYTPFHVELPKYTALPPSDRDGSRAALLDGFLYSCGGREANGSDMKLCLKTTPRRQEWSTAPDLKVSFESLTMKGLTAATYEANAGGLEWCTYPPP